MMPFIRSFADELVKLAAPDSPFEARLKPVSKPRPRRTKRPVAAKRVATPKPVTRQLDANTGKIRPGLTSKTSPPAGQMRVPRHAATGKKVTNTHLWSKGKWKPRNPLHRLRQRNAARDLRTPSAQDMVRAKDKRDQRRGVPMAGAPMSFLSGVTGAVGKIPGYSLDEADLRTKKEKARNAPKMSDYQSYNARTYPKANLAGRVVGHGAMAIPAFAKGVSTSVINAGSEAADRVVRAARKLPKGGLKMRTGIFPARPDA